jgi:hypothetical protein
LFVVPGNYPDAVEQIARDKPGSNGSNHRIVGYQLHNRIDTQQEVNHAPYSEGKANRRKQRVISVRNFVRGLTIEWKGRSQHVHHQHEGEGQQSYKAWRESGEHDMS